MMGLPVTVPQRCPAITIWQPWAQATMPVYEHSLPLKYHETRGWAAPGGWIGQAVAIHAASKRVPNTPLLRRSRLGDELCQVLDRVWLHRFGGDWSQRLSYGSVIGVAILIKCFKIAGKWEALTDLDACLGNWRRGRFAWRFAHAIELPRPIPCLGQQRVWYLPEAVSRQVNAQLRGGHMT